MKEKTCLWTISDHVFHEDSRNYETECYEMMFFTDGGLYENNFNYCPFCGGKIKDEEVM